MAAGRPREETREKEGEERERERERGSRKSFGHPSAVTLRPRGGLSKENHVCLQMRVELTSCEAASPLAGVLHFTAVLQAGETRRRPRRDGEEGGYDDIL